MHDEDPGVPDSLLLHPCINDIQYFLCFPSAYVLLCCSRHANTLLQDVALYELSARRLALIRQIPSYIAFHLRTSYDIEQQELSLCKRNLPPIPTRILHQADEAEQPCDILHLPLNLPRVTDDAPNANDAGAALLNVPAMVQAKVTYLFVHGLRAYEEKNWMASKEFLEQAHAILPGDDIIASRLADTCFGKFQAIKHGNDAGSAQDWELKTLGLYQQALRVNPKSSYGYNGLALFQDTSSGKIKCLLRAVTLDPQNSYALINLAMHLLTTASHEDCLHLAQRAVAINPRLFYARITIADLLIRLQRFEDALSVLREQLSCRPHDTQARNLHDQLEVALSRMPSPVAATATDGASDVE